jgi:hypothetical protein
MLLSDVDNQVFSSSNPHYYFTLVGISLKTLDLFFVIQACDGVDG